MLTLSHPLTSAKAPRNTSTQNAPVWEAFEQPHSPSMLTTHSISPVRLLRYVALDVVGYLWRARGAEFRDKPGAQAASKKPTAEPTGPPTKVTAEDAITKSTPLNAHVLRAVVLQVRTPGYSTWLQVTEASLLVGARVAACQSRGLQGRYGHLRRGNTSMPVV